MNQPEATSFVTGTPRKQQGLTRFLRAQGNILRRIAARAPVEDCLASLCEALEGAVDGARCVVMVMDPEDQTLRIGAARGLSDTFLSAIDRLVVGTAPGSASEATATDSVVVSSPIAEDPSWIGLRDSAKKESLAACWSQPIRSQHTPEPDAGGTRPLGTLDLYFQNETSPSPAEFYLIELAALLAGLALDIGTRTADPPLAEGGEKDALTQLPNRREFQALLEETIAGADPKQSRVAILIVDLDRFKEINETFGHGVGDFLLRSVGQRLEESRQPSDVLARFGDDEFGLLVANLDRDDQLREVAAQLLETINRPFDFGGHELAATASIGASLYPWDGEDAQTLLRNAENALQTAKRNGRNRYRIYAATMGGDAFEKLQLKLALGYALENDEMELFYQPKVSAKDGTIVGAEALIRWNHPTDGQLKPDSFIPLAEETGQIVSIGRWVLSRACFQARHWHDAGFPDLTVAVNISAHQFRERSFVDEVAGTLRESELNPAALELEITETVAMTEVEKTMDRLHDLTALGVRISIDDFGTGYSSLAYLKRFPIHTLKIDRSFVQGVPRNVENTAIVKAVVALAGYMNMDVVAEGVESLSQVDFFAELGCSLLQGYYFSEPISIIEFSRLLGSGCQIIRNVSN